ncbi:MAG: ABC transporter permease [Candidatus Thorarchaeota archaeon]
MSDTQESTTQKSDQSSEEKSKIEQFIAGLITKFTSKEFINQAIWTLGSILLALVVAAVIMLMGGYDPGQAFLWLTIGAITQFDQVLWYASPLIIAGLSVALAFRCGLFNIGAEGQLYMGSMTSALLAYIFAFPVLVHPILCLIAGMLAGAAWGFVPGLLKAYRGAHEVVTTMMLSYTAILFTSWLVGSNGPFWDGSWVSQTPQFYDTALLPMLFGNYLHFGFIIALMAVFSVDYLINRTVLGYELRAVGNNLDAAEYAGINSKRNIVIALSISGALAGLAGATEMIGTYDRFIANWSSGIGWDGITVAVLGRNNPWGVLAGGIFFGALKAGGNTMHAIAHVPIEMVKVIQGLIVLFVAAPRIIEWLMKHSQENKEEATADPAKVLPRLLIAIFGLASVFIGLGAARAALISGSLSPITSIAALILILTAVLGVMLFIAEYSRDPRGSKLLLILGIGWLLGGGIFSIGIGYLDITPIMMGVIALVFWFAMLRLKKPETEEVPVQ